MSKFSEQFPEPRPIRAVAQQQEPQVPKDKELRPEVGWSEQATKQGGELVSQIVGLQKQLDKEEDLGEQRRLLEQMETLTAQLEGIAEKEAEEERRKAEKIEFFGKEIRRDQIVFIEDLAVILLKDQLQRQNPGRDREELFNQLDPKEKEEGLKEFQERIVEHQTTINEQGFIQVLYCSNNQLTQLPELPENLQRLDCYNNQLTQLPELPENLQEIYCDNNQLTPQSIAKIRAHKNSNSWSF